MTAIVGKTFAFYLVALCVTSGCGSSSTSNGGDEGEANRPGGQGGAHDANPDPEPNASEPTLQQSAERYCQVHSAECEFGDVEDCLSDMQDMVGEIESDDFECGQAGAEWIQCLGTLESCDELVSFDSGRSDIVACLMDAERDCDDVFDGSGAEYPCASEDRAVFEACLF